jgi:hypothetical protein
MNVKVCERKQLSTSSYRVVCLGVRRITANYLVRTVGALTIFEPDTSVVQVTSTTECSRSVCGTKPGPRRLAFLSPSTDLITDIAVTLKGQRTLQYVTRNVRRSKSSCTRRWDPSKL